jgi:hypothetical protein
VPSRRGDFSSAVQGAPRLDAEVGINVPPLKLVERAESVTSSLAALVVHLRSVPITSVAIRTGRQFGKVVPMSLQGGDQAAEPNASREARPRHQ